MQSFCWSAIRQGLDSLLSQIFLQYLIVTDIHRQSPRMQGIAQPTQLSTPDYMSGIVRYMSGVAMQTEPLLCLMAQINQSSSIGENLVALFNEIHV